MESAWYKKICVIWCFKEEKEKKKKNDSHVSEKGKTYLGVILSTSHGEQSLWNE